MLELNSLYNMDCMDGIKLIDDCFIDLTVTSPPYDQIRTYDGYQWDYRLLIPELYRVTKSGGVVVWIVNDQTIDGSETGTSFRQALCFMDSGFKLHDTMIWRKVSPYTHPNRYIACFEYMFVFSKCKPASTNIIQDRMNLYSGIPNNGTQREKDGRLHSKSSKKTGRVIKEYGARFNVWDIPAEGNETGHPAVFPLKLVTDHIITWSNENDVVFDPFMGSGTTAIACVEVNRNFLGFEISENYYNAAQERVQAVMAQTRMY